MRNKFRGNLVLSALKNKKLLRLQKKLFLEFREIFLEFQNLNKSLFKIYLVITVIFLFSSNKKLKKKKN